MTAALIFTVGLIAGTAFGIGVSLWLPRRSRKPAPHIRYHRDITVRRRAL